MARGLTRGDVCLCPFPSPDKRRECGLKAPSVVSLDQVTTVRKAILGQWLGRVDETRMQAVCRALAVALGCNESPLV